MLEVGVKVQRNILRNIHGWTLVYVSYTSGEKYDTVTIEKIYRGMPAGEIEMSRQEAREHYAAQIRAGFFRFQYPKGF